MERGFFLASSQMIHQLEDQMHLRVNMKAGQVEMMMSLETMAAHCGFFCHNASTLQNNFKSYAVVTRFDKKVRKG